MRPPRLPGSPPARDPNLPNTQNQRMEVQDRPDPGGVEGRSPRLASPHLRPKLLRAQAVAEQVGQGSEFGSDFGAQARGVQGYGG
ncbi:MAG: hypothetical protein JWO24_3504 [Rhodospirillales bacterium]|nr:hypothetical protein [Rhodospirillales bacterium]